MQGIQEICWRLHACSVGCVIIQDLIQSGEAHWSVDMNCMARHIDKLVSLSHAFPVGLNRELI